VIAGIVVAILGAIAVGIGFIPSIKGIAKIIVIVVGFILLIGGGLFGWLQYQKESKAATTELVQAKTEQTRAAADTNVDVIKAKAAAFTQCQNDCLKNQGLFKDPKACDQACNRAVGR